MNDPSPAVRVRALVPGDAAAFQALRLQGLREWPSAFASSYEEECDTPRETVASRLAERPGKAVFGAFDGDRLVGIVALEREQFRKLAHKAGVWGMYVHPDARKRGVGHALVSHALAYARETLGVRQVGLAVNATNFAAIALYRRLGFEPFGLEPGFMLVDGELQDEIHMLRVL